MVTDKEDHTKMYKKIFYAAMLLAVFICFLLLYFIANPFKGRIEEEPADQPLGTFSYEEIEEFEDTTDEYDPSLEPGSELAVNNVYFTNYELLYDFLALEAAGSISSHAAEFLNEHGYGGYHELTILKDTISKEDTYPRFICRLDDTEKYIEVRYRTDLKEFAFSFIDSIY